LQATLDATNEGILVMDDKGRMANHNKRFTEIWSIPDDIMNTHDATKALEYAMQLVLNPVPFRESVEEALNKNDKETVYVVHFKDGRVIELRSKPHFLDGESAGTIWSSRDITQSVKAEEDLKAKLAALELLNKSMVDRELKMIELKKKIAELSKDNTL
jgi:PAS domain-containing protein